MGVPMPSRSASAAHPKTCRPGKFSLCCNHPCQAFKVEGSEDLEVHLLHDCQALLVESICCRIVSVKSNHLCQVGKRSSFFIQIKWVFLSLEVFRTFLQERAC